MTGVKRISQWQLAMLLIPLIIATEILPVTDLSAKFAHQRTWLCMLPSTITGIWSIWVMTELYRRHPGKSVVEYSMDILGKWAGRLVGVIILMQMWIYASKVASEELTFISMFALPRTPKFIILMLFLIVAGTAAWCGLEVVARCAELFVPLLVVFFGIVFVCLIPNMHPSYIRPIMGPYWMQTVFQAAILPSAWYGEFLILGFLLPFLANDKAMRRTTYGVLIFLAVFLVGIALQSIMVAGPLTEKLTYSYYVTARYISLGDFFERIDPLIVSLWMYGLIIKEAICLFVLALCVVHLIGLSDHQLVMVPVTLLTLTACLWFFPNLSELRSFLTYTFPFEGFVVQNLLPTFILLVDMMRSKMGKPAHA